MRNINVYLPFLLLLFIATTPFTNAAEVPVIPHPSEVTVAKGVTFTLSSATAIESDQKQRVNAELLQNYLKQDTGLVLQIKKSRADAIRLITNKKLESELGKEGYNLTVSSNEVTITAPGTAGIFYGIQTLRQIAAANLNKNSATLPGIKISDKPAFAYRGMMLDTGRHYYTPEFIKKFIDIMAMHKMNVFHWHFIEDAGWRPEIKKYPLLTEKGAFREQNGKKIGGFYTQEQMKEIVKYAQERHIEIIPEVELPAHTLAALVAYPYLGCVGKGYKMPDKQFISHDIYCVGNKKTLAFLFEVLNEIADIFPGRYIHIGGDEAKYDKWKACPKCQALKKQLGLKTEKQLQGWLTTKVEKFLAEKNKKILGWDEILTCGVSKNAAIMVWRQKGAAKNGAEKGHDVVIALTSSCYFDTPESKLPGEPPAATWIPPISLQKAYNWDPMPNGISENGAKHILGPEACIWSDQILNHKELQPQKISENYVQYLLLPRLAALAEVAWTPKNLRNWDSFQNRMAYLYRMYDKLHYNFRVPLPIVKITPKNALEKTYSFKSPIAGGKICYEIGGKQPTAASKVCNTPITVKNTVTLKAVTVTPYTQRCSLVYNSRADAEKYAKYGGEFIGTWSASRNKTAVSFDLTGKINGDGRYKIKFVQLGGNKRGKTTIENISLIRNGKDKLLTVSTPVTLSRAKQQGVTITIDVKGYETGASFKLTAQISNPKRASGIALIAK